jgi:hypothetical protein
MANRYIEAQYGDNPTQPRAEVYPSTIILPIDHTVLAGATIDLRKNARGVLPTTFTDIPIVTRYWLSLTMRCSLVAGGAIIIRLTDDTIWLGDNRWNILPIYGAPNFTNRSMIEVPGGSMALQLRNNDAINAQSFNGNIILRSV